MLNICDFYKYIMHNVKFRKADTFHVVNYRYGKLNFKQIK